MNMMGPSFCLVYSYNASTNIASAYFSIEKHRKTSLNPQPYHRTNIINQPANPAAPSRFEEVMKIIKACAAQATHPAFLLLMVTAHVSEIVGQAVNTTLFDISIIERFTNIVESLAIVESSSMQTVDDAHRKLATLSASLPSLWNSLDTHLIGCVEDIVKGLSEKLLLDEEFYMKHNTELLGLIGYLREHAKSHARMAEEVEKRAGTQFRIVSLITLHSALRSPKTKF